MVITAILLVVLVYMRYVEPLSSFIKSQQRNYAMHVIRMPLQRNVKSLLFNDDKYVLRGRPSKTLIDQVTQNEFVSTLHWARK